MVSRNAVRNEILRLRHVLHEQLKAKTDNAGIGLTTVSMAGEQELGQKMLVQGSPKAFVEFFEITTTLQPEPTNAEDEAAGIRFPVAEAQRRLKHKDVLGVLYKHLVAAELAGRDANNEQLFVALTGAGDLFDQTHYYPTSIAYYSRALHAAEHIISTRNTSHVAKAKYNLGKMYWKTDNSGGAIKCLEESLDLARFINDGQQIVAAAKDLLEMYWDCAENCRAQGKLRQSITNLDKCVLMGRACADTCRGNEARYHAGLLYGKLLEFDKALKYQSDCLDLAKSIGDKVGECQAHAALSEVYEAQDNVKLAVVHLKCYISVASTLNLKMTAIGHCLLGSLYHRRDQRVEAIEQFANHFAIARELKHPDLLDVSRVNSGIARLYKTDPAVMLGAMCPYWAL